MKIKLSTIKLKSIDLSSVSIFGEKTISRYVPDDKVPNTHHDFLLDDDEFVAADGSFYVKK